MKIKLNLKQIESLRREIKEGSRKNFDLQDVSQVFKMLQYWVKAFGSGEEKIQSIAELGDGYLCRVNRKFRDSMKQFLREAKSRRLSEQMKERESERVLEEYERLIEEAEEKHGGTDRK